MRLATVSAVSTVELAIDVSDELASVLARWGSEAGHYPVHGPDPWRILWNSERPERRTDSFLRNSFTEPAHRRRFFVAQGPARIEASGSCTPVSAEGWYLQDPVRAPDAPRGALEGAMTLALQTFRDEGYLFASNGPLPFWRPDGATEPTSTLGVLGGRVLAYVDYRYRFRHINQFRSQFIPDRTIPL